MIVVNNREELLIYTRNTAWWNRLNELDVSRVTDFSWLFVDEGGSSYSNFNSSSISNWDTSAATTMKGMFYSCNFFNQPINFNTSNVISMSQMFAFCRAFNQPLNFDTSNVTEMSRMFYSCNSFNQNLSSWIVYCDVYKYDMFTGSAITPPEYSSYPWWSPDTCTPRPIKINYSNVMIF